MLVFYPDFELDYHPEEVVLVLDTSESMRGESLGLAQRIALQVLNKLQDGIRVNVVLFGTGWFGSEHWSKPHLNAESALVLRSFCRL